jgi:flagellar assembly protein FliH
MGCSPEDTAKSIVGVAREEAAGLVAAAQADVESIRSQAYSDGHSAGLQELERERLAVAERLARIESDNEAKLEEFWVSTEPELLRLAVEIARKIVRKEIEEADGFVLGTVRAGIRQLRDKQDVKVRVNPGDYDLAREHKEEIAGMSDGIRTVEVIEDRRVDEGGCIIESGNGHLDARVESQLKEVERALLEAERYGKDDDNA